MTRAGEREENRGFKEEIEADTEKRTKGEGVPFGGGGKKHACYPVEQWSLSVLV